MIERRVVMKEVVKTLNDEFCITDLEKNLISLIREIKFGSIEKIMIQNGQPTIVESVKKRIDLAKDKIS